MSHDIGTASFARQANKGFHERHQVTSRGLIMTYQPLVGRSMCERALQTMPSLDHASCKALTLSQ